MGPGGVTYKWRVDGKKLEVFICLLTLSHRILRPFREAIQYYESRANCTLPATPLQSFLPLMAPRDDQSHL